MKYVFESERERATYLKQEENTSSVRVRLHQLNIRFDHLLDQILFFVDKFKGDLKNKTWNGMELQIHMILSLRRTKSCKTIRDWLWL